MEFVIEDMEGAKSSLKEDMNRLEERFTQEIELLKGVLHKHSDDLDWSSKIREMYGNNIKENNLQIVANNQKIESLKLELQQVETRILDKIGERFDDHKDRVAILEKNQIVHP
ncbi:MAG: hypothetical protein HYY43_06575 [Deltaproteobacteria bacterium]|nr:hypothetical protein [Deltaproteobacteria bacterium]